jgi:plasmid maintenance system antidote protein VapI
MRTTRTSHGTKLIQSVTRQLSQVRDDEGISNNALARKLHIDRSAITRIFNGHQNMTLETIARLADALHRDVEIRLLRRAR